MKSLRRAAGITALAGLSFLNSSEARADFYQDLARVYNLPLEVIQNLRGNAFNDLTLRGLIKDKSYNLQDESFRTFLTSRYRDEGEKIWGFLTQENVRDVGVTTDDLTGRVFIKRVMATPDSTQIQSIELTDKTGRDMNRLALGINSAQSALYDVRQDSSSVEFEIEGTDNREVMQNLGTILRKPFRISPFVNNDEVDIFGVESGIQQSLGNFFDYFGDNSLNVKTLFADFNNNIKVSYRTNEGKAVIELSLVDTKDNRILAADNYSYSLSDLPSGNFNFTNPEDMKSIGLEELASVEASADSTALIAALKKHEKKVEKRRAEARPGVQANIRWTTVAGGGYNDGAEGLVGARRTQGRSFQEFLVGAGIGGSDVNGLYEGTAREGEQTIIKSSGNENVRKVLAGVTIGHMFSPKFSMSLSAYAGMKMKEITGTETPERYKNEELIRANPAQPWKDKQNGLYGVVGMGMGTKDLRLEGNYDLSGKSIGGRLMLNFGGFGGQK